MELTKAGYVLDFQPSKELIYMYMLLGILTNPGKLHWQHQFVLVLFLSVLGFPSALPLYARVAVH